MAIPFGPLDKMLGEILETWERRYAFEFDREKRQAFFGKNNMFVHAEECLQYGDDLLLVTYDKAPGEREYEFCTPTQAADLINALMEREQLCQLPKYGRPPLMVMQFCRGPEQALGLEFYPDDPAAFARELPRCKTALARWQATHGENCVGMSFSVITPAAHHPAIETLIRQFCREDPEVIPLVQSLDIRVALLTDARREPVKEYLLP